MVLSTKSARYLTPADLEPAPKYPHCHLAIAEFESCPDAVHQFTGTLRLGKCYQRFSIWAAGDRFRDMIAAKDLGFHGWTLIGETQYVAA